MRPQTTTDLDQLASQARDWLVGLASGTMDDVQMRAFERWLERPGHRAVFEHERQLWRSLGPPPARPAAAPRRRRGALLALAAAAALACVAAMPELRVRLQADHRTGTEIASLQLPDGSRAVLDAGAAISVRFDGQVRHVTLLRGRAWFEVVPGREAPFQVTTDAGVVEDIATAFVVAREGGRTTAAVEHGRVRVAAAPGHDWIYLDTGQGAAWGAGERPLRQPDQRAEDVAAWRHGELLLDAVPVPDAIAQLQRYRAGRIVVQGDLASLPRVSAALRIDRPDEALDTLAASSGLVVTRLPLGLALVRRRS